MPTEGGHAIDRFYLCLFFTVLCMVSISFFSRIWDPDFFWHLATGRWIVENMSLPARDPFTTFSFGTDREALILKGYWLTQVFYYFVSAISGAIGLALFKSASFVVLFGTVLWHHLRRKTSPVWVFLAILPLYDTMLDFRADRPNMVSLLFFTILIALLAARQWRFLPFLMLAWANSHGGYLLGDLVIVVYVGVLVLGRQESFLPVTGWALAAIAVSFLNPLGFFPVLFLMEFDGSLIQKGTFEFLSPVRIALDYRDYYIGYFMALFLSLSSFLFFRRPAVWGQLAILALTIVISLKHARYIPFLVISCAFFVPSILDRISLSTLLRRSLLSCSIMLIIMLFFFDLRDGRGLTWGLEPGRFPEKGVEFIAGSGGEGQIFCNFEWGGYLIWTLPKATILNDSRGLTEQSFLKNRAIQNAQPGWEQSLISMNTSLIVVSAFNPVTGGANKLWRALLYDDNWSLVYADDVTLVYSRTDFDRNLPQIDSKRKHLLSLNHALSQIVQFVKKYPQTPLHWADLGYIHVLRGEIQEAVAAYRKALSLDPGNRDYLAKLSMLGAG